MWVEKCKRGLGSLGREKGKKDFFKKMYFIDIYLIDNVVLISAVQQ